MRRFKADRLRHNYHLFIRNTTGKNVNDHILYYVALLVKVDAVVCTPTGR